MLDSSAELYSNWYRGEMERHSLHNINRNQVFKQNVRDRSIVNGQQSQILLNC